MRSQVDALLGEEPHEWEVLSVDDDEETARRWSDEIPVLFVNGRLFAKGSLPALAARERLMRASAEPEAGEEGS
jgi:hypothetical protein